jgi:hypothetical protein
MHEALLASLVANGLSHAAGATQRWTQDSPGSGTWSYNGGYGNDNESTTPPSVVMTFQGRPPEFAWNLDDAPIKIALPILMLCCTYVVVYVAYTFATGRSSTTWSGVSDLVVVVLASAPPEGEALEHTSAGITRVGTFRKGFV